MELRGKVTDSTDWPTRSAGTARQARTQNSTRQQAPYQLTLIQCQYYNMRCCQIQAWLPLQIGHRFLFSYETASKL